MAPAQHTGSYYAATANPAPERPTLSGEVDCDVCVIGAGFTGLSTALHLAERGYDVVVLDGSRVAWGASGRNGGQIVNGFNRDLDGIALRYGKDTSQAVGAMLTEGAQIIRQRIETYDIKCDLKDGAILAAMTAKQLRGLEKRMVSWQTAGHDGLELIPAERIRDYVNTGLYCGGLLDRKGGHIHPMNLALGEAAAIESNGGTIFENSTVVRVERGPRIAAYTADGVVRADFLVACGNAYLGNLIPEIATKVMPASSQVTTTEVLGAEITDRLIPQDNCIEDANYFLDYYRITADKRLLFGGGTVYGGKDPSDIRAELRPHIARTFPELKDVKIDFAWSGNICLTVSRVPHMGRLDDNIYYSHGYSGHGVTGTHVAGRLIAEALSQQSERFDVFGNLTHLPFPGGKHLRVPLTIAGSWYYRFLERVGL
ncbi:MAG: FAD-binding oxidoreductase [Pseudomonadota bacterium]